MFKPKTPFQINMLMMCMEGMYNDSLFRESIKETFSGDGYIMCHGFFKPDMVELLSNELFSNNLQWLLKGPFNKRYLSSDF